MGSQLTVSPDGKWYARLTHDGQISIVSTKDGFEYRRFGANDHSFGTNMYVSVAISPDGKTLAASFIGGYGNYSAKSRIKRFDVDTTKALPDLEFGNGSTVLSVAYHPREDVIAAVLDSGAVYVLRGSNGEVLFTSNLKEAASSSFKVQFSASGEALVALSEDEASLWDWRDKRQVWTVSSKGLHSGNLGRSVSATEVSPHGFIEVNKSAGDLGWFHFTAAAFSPSGKTLAFVHNDEVSLVDGDTGMKTATISLGTSSGLSALFLDENRIFIGTPGASLVYDIAARTAASDPAKSIISALAIPFSRNFLISSGYGEAIHELGGHSSVDFRESNIIADGVGAFSPDGTALLDGDLSRWNLTSGESDPPPPSKSKPWGTFTQSADGNLVAYYTKDTVEPGVSYYDKVAIWNWREHRVIGELASGIAGNKSSIAFSPDGKWLACITGAPKMLRIWSLPSMTPVVTPGNPPFADDFGEDGNLSFNLTSDLLAITSERNVLIYSLPSLVVVKTISIDRETVSHSKIFIGGAVQEQRNRIVSLVSFSPDGQKLAVQGEIDTHVFDTATWTEQLTIFDTLPFCMAFSPDSNGIAVMKNHGSGTLDKLTIWNLSGNVATFESTADGCEVAFNKNGSLLASRIGNGVGLFRSTDGVLLASLYRFKVDRPLTALPGKDGAPDWLVVTPDGLFDGTPSAWKQTSWRFGGKTFELAPTEVYFREFYHPGLLAEIAQGKTFKAPADITLLDRRRPEVQIVAGNTTAAGDQDHVHLDINLVESRKPVEGIPKGSGARDLRLFRNGTLVKVWRGDLKLDADGKARFSTEVPIVQGENLFTAYAFNRSDIKSADSTLTITGSDKLARKGIAYVLAIGINSYAADAPAQPMNLNFAEADAKDFYETFAKSQTALQQFAEVKPIVLLSADATRANILAALSVMGGAPRDTLTQSQQALLTGISAVRPEDGVFIFYAGHGAVDEQQTHFYLLPTDFDPKASFDKAASQSISETDLSIALEPISPARSFLVIDACHSGKAIDAEKVGPMNATGLAQLAYEKGMYILAASQGRESALEAPQLAGGHGYLTFALVEE
jgi:hypothetical protein